MNGRPFWVLIFRLRAHEVRNCHIFSCAVNGINRHGLSSPINDMYVKVMSSSHLRNVKPQVMTIQFAIYLRFNSNFFGGKTLLSGFTRKKTPYYVKYSSIYRAANRCEMLKLCAAHCGSVDLISGAFNACNPAQPKSRPSTIGDVSVLTTLVRTLSLTRRLVSACSKRLRLNPALELHQRPWSLPVLDRLQGHSTLCQFFRWVDQP